MFPHSPRNSCSAEVPPQLLTATRAAAPACRVCNLQEAFPSGGIVPLLPLGVRALVARGQL
eukprot:450454-Lingulodinium_polyedra.AAC.1